MDDDEIDLTELALSVLARWPIVVLAVLLGFILSSFLAVRQPMIYKAQSIFDILLNGEAVSDSFLDKINGEEFARDVVASMRLADDPRFVGISLGSTEVAIAAYISSVAVSRTENESFILTVTHADPTAAADLANAAVEYAILSIREERSAEIARMKNDLSPRLAEAVVRLRESRTILDEYQAQNGLSDNSSEEMLSLQHAVSSAEADYNILLEELRVLASTAQLEVSTRIYQRAFVPTTPQPERPNLVLELGPFLGLSAGLGCAFLLAWRSGRLYSVAAIKKQAGVHNVIQLGPSRSGVYRAEASSTGLLIMVLKHPTNLIVVASTGPGLDSAPVAMRLAEGMVRQGRTVSLLCLGERPDRTITMQHEKPDDGLLIGQHAGVTVYAAVENASVADFLLSERLSHMADKAKSSGYYLLVATSEDWAAPILQGLRAHNPYVVAVAKTRFSRRQSLQDLRDDGVPNAIVMVG